MTRGLSVGLVEARDWASGTSSRSSKLVHGGIRYLEQLDFRLVREALTERGLLLQRLAPHLVKPVKFLYPLSSRVIERFYVGTGMLLYDIFSYTGGRSPGVPHHKHMTKGQVRRAVPSLAAETIVGGITYYDAQVDDARYVATLARTASFYGAHVASRMRVEGFLKVGERVVGVRVHDLEGGERFEIHAKQVVNATGVWTDDTQAMVGERGQFKVRASKGIHLLVPRDRFHSTMGLLLRTEKSVLFVIPWGRHWLIGTTDTDWHLDKAHPAATAADIDYLLEHVNSVLVGETHQGRRRGRLRGAAPAARRRVGADLQTVAGTHRRALGARPGRGRRRQVDDLPGDGEGCDRRGGRGARREGARQRDRRHPAARRRGVPRGLEQAGQDRQGVRRASGADRAPAEPLRDADRRPARPDPRDAVAGGIRCPVRTTTSRRRSSTPPRTRARCTWRMCSPAAPGSRSRPGTAGCRRRRSPHA